jgi:hypothetical protein
MTNHMTERTIVIIARNSERFEFDASTHHWHWGITPGTIDRDDFGRVEVWQSPDDPDEEGERVAIIIEPAAVLITKRKGPTASQLRMFDQILADRLGFTDDERLTRAWDYARGAP